MNRCRRSLAAACAMAFMAVAVPSNADRIDDNVDSLCVGRLTHFLALDQYTYDFADTIYISTSVSKWPTNAGRPLR